MRIDVRGEICPYPLKKTLDALNRLSAGEDLEVLTDHHPSLDVIRLFAGQKGFTVRVEDVGPGEWRIILTRKGEVPT